MAEITNRAGWALGSLQEPGAVTTPPIGMRALGPRFQQTVHLQLTFASSLASHPLLTPIGLSRPPPSLGALVFPAPHPMPTTWRQGLWTAGVDAPSCRLLRWGEAVRMGALQKLGEAAQGAQAPWLQAQSLAGGQGGPPHSLLAHLPSRCRRPGPVLWVGDGQWRASFWESGGGGDAARGAGHSSRPPLTSCGPRTPCSWKAWSWIWN